jgi:hypothetical protein
MVFILAGAARSLSTDDPSGFVALWILLQRSLGNFPSDDALFASGL